MENNNDLYVLDVFQFVNELRKSPNDFATKYLEPRLKFFRGDIYCEPGLPRQKTREGEAAFVEAISDLGLSVPTNELIINSSLVKAAQMHVQEQGATYDCGHIGSDGSTPQNRCQNAGYLGRVGENIDYGAKNALDVVISLLVEDGVPDRGHRKNLLNPIWREIGIAYGSHKRCGKMCVMDFGG